MPAKVRFEGQGVDRRGATQTAIEVVVAAAYAFLAIAFILGPLPSWFWLVKQPVSVVFVSAPLLSWVAAIGFGLAVVLRRHAAREWLADRDFRVVKSIQDASSSLFKMLIVASAFWVGLTLLSPQSFLKYAFLLLGLFLLLLPIYCATRFYSSKGSVRVCLLQFLEERSESDDWLDQASKALVKTLRERGLQARPYDIRAGVNLGLMRGTIDGSELQDLANSIVRIGNKEDDKKVIQSLQGLLWEVRPSARILPMRPMRYRITTSAVTGILAAFLVPVLAELPAIIKSIQTALGLP